MRWDRRLAVCVLTMTWILLAAEQTQAQPPPDRNDASATPASPDKSDQGADAWERLIYLPYQNLRDVFEKHGAAVFLPYLEYLKLWERSSGGMRAMPGGPPVQAVISEAHYVARVDQDLARIEAGLTVLVLGKPWAEVPLAFGGAAVGKITSENEQVVLRGSGEGEYSLLLPTAGQHRVTLELVSRIHTSPDGRQFELSCPPVGITTFELVVPERDQTVEITPHLVSLPSDAGADETRVKASLGSTAKIAAHWHPRTGLKPEMDLLASVNNRTHVSIGDGLVHTDATLVYEVLRGTVNELRVAVPLGHRILDVSSPDAKLEGWQAVAEEKRQLVTIKLLSQVEKKVTIEVHTERPQPDETFPAGGIDDDGVVHGIHAVDAVRESGQFVLSHAADLALAVERQAGLSRIDSSEVSQELQHANAQYYKFYSPRYRLDVSARPVEPRLSVEHATRLVLREDELRLNATLAYQIERAGVFSLAIRLPEGLAVDNVAADGMKEFRVDDETRTLTVSLSEKRQGVLTVEVAGRQEIDPEVMEAEQVLPLLEPLGVERETGRVLVYAPPAIEVISDEDAVVGAYPEPVVDASAVAGARFVSAWTYTRRPVEIGVKTRRKPTRLTANVGTTVNLQEQLAEVATLLELHVEFAGIDTFRFSVPEAVSSRVDVQPIGGGSIKQKSPADEAQDGWIVWTVVMQSDVLGVQQLRVSYDTPYAAPGDGAGDEAEPAPPAGQPPDLVLQPLRVLDPYEEDAAAKVTLSSIEGEIVVTKDRALSVSVSATEGELEPIDIRELELLPKAGYLAFRYYKQPVDVSLVKRKHEIQQVVETIVSKALVEVVLTRDQSAAYRCRYVMKSSERQRLRVDLPQGVEILGVLVDQTLTAPEKNAEAAPNEHWDSFFVNVARNKKSDEPFSLTLQFRDRVAAFDQNGGRVALRVPQIGEPARDSVVVQHLRSVVWVPDEFSLVGTPDGFVREVPTRIAGLFGAGVAQQTDSGPLESWIGVPVTGMFEFPTEGHYYRYGTLNAVQSLEVTWWRTTFLTWVLSGAAVLIGWVLLRTSWQNRLSIVLLVAFLAALYAVKDEDWVLHLLIAARWGLLTTLAIWLIHALTSARPQHLTTTAPTPSGPGASVAAAVIPPPGVFDELNQ